MRRPSDSVSLRNECLLENIINIKAEYSFWGYRRVWAYLGYISGLIINKNRLMRVYKLTVKPNPRLGDIEKLARAFLESYSKRYGMAFKPLTYEDIAYLESYLWPGNIRELQNAIERGVITSTNGRLDLGKALPALMDNNLLGSVSTTHNDETYVLSDMELRELEKNNIIRALEMSGWKVAGLQGAAAILAIPTSTLNSKIKTFGIDKPSRISL